MSAAIQPGLLAIDIGTSRVKLGWFPSPASCTSPEIKNPSPPQNEVLASPEYQGGGLKLPIAAPRLPEPMETFDCAHRDQSKLQFAEELASWLGQFVDHKPQAVVASVSPDVTTTVANTLKLSGFAAPRILKTSELPIQLAVNEPDKLGIDRALAAVAVNRLRSANTPAIVISLGTACTVNLISAEGVFEGGAILPGLTMAANALHSGTASLPLISPESWQLPQHAIGKNTNEAMSAGIYWGLIGALEKIIAQQSQSVGSQPQLFLTGGDAPHVLDALKTSGLTVRLIPHLVLAGIAISCEAKL